MRLLGRGLAAVAAAAVLAAPSATATPKSALAPASITLPTRAAFYYPWFPEVWTVKGAHVFYQPTLGYYDSSAAAVIDAHIGALDYAKVAVSIASWWGPGTHQESVRTPLLLDRTAALGSPLKWALYHEQEGQRNPTVAELQADLAYVSFNYATHPGYAHVNGKPVIFAYNPTDTACEVADRWSQASGGAWYVVLLVLPGYRTCPSQPDSWHNYAPAHAEDSRPGYSFSISPGFWRADEPTPRLGRDLDRFRQNIRNMIASQEPWQLITTFNEWGEGTAVESAAEWGEDYLTALRNDGQVPTAVTVHAVRAVKTGAGVLLRWRTTSGSRALGFNVYRDRNGKRLKLNHTLIVSVPNERRYSWRDRGVSRTGALRYWLEEISVSATRRGHGPILVAGT